MALKTAMYMRVSTVDQSVDSQRRELEDFIERCEADGMTHFGEVPYSVRSYFEALAIPLRPPPGSEDQR